MSDLLNELEGESFDYIIDLHQNIRSNQIKRRLRVPAFSFQKLNIQKWLIVNFKVNKLPDVHIVDRYLDTLSVFDIHNDNQGLDFFIPESSRYDFHSLGEKFRQGYIAFVIAGTYFTKKLPLDSVAEICAQTDKPVLLLGGRKEEHEGAELSVQDPERIVNLCGKTSLGESADIVKNARLVLTNDTGLMHIAAAFRKKILSFWGNTIPEFGMVPYLPHPASHIMEVKNLKCRPCSKLGYEKCPKKHFRCMRELSTKEAISWIDKNY